MARGGTIYTMSATPLPMPRWGGMVSHLTHYPLTVGVRCLALVTRGGVGPSFAHPPLLPPPITHSTTKKIQNTKK